MRKFLGASTEAAGCDGVTRADLIVRPDACGQSGFRRGGVAWLRGSFEELETSALIGELADSVEADVVGGV